MSDYLNAEADMGKNVIHRKGVSIIFFFVIKFELRFFSFYLNILRNLIIFIIFMFNYVTLTKTSFSS